MSLSEESEMLRYRRATLADRGAVLAILPDCYGGYDNLAHRYHRYLGPRSRDVGFVAETADTGDVVAFLLLVFKDGGRTVVSRAKRVRPEYQGRGVMKQLDHVAHAYLRHCQDTAPVAATRHAAVVDAALSPFLLNPKFWERHSLQQENWFYRLHISGEDLVRGVRGYGKKNRHRSLDARMGASSPVRKMSSGESRLLFAAPEKFPALRLREVMSGWQSYALSEDNYKTMMAVEEAEFYADSWMGPRGRGTCCMSVGSEYATWRHGATALGYDINLYCACTAHLRHHLHHHMKVLAERFPEGDTDFVIQIVLHHQDASGGQCGPYDDHVVDIVADSESADEDSESDGDDSESESPRPESHRASAAAPDWSSDRCKWEVFDLLRSDLALPVDGDDFNAQLHNAQVVYESDIL